MIEPDAHPMDVLHECVCKAAFLADTVMFIAEDTKYNLSPKGLYGLGPYLSELERNLGAIKKVIDARGGVK